MCARSVDSQAGLSIDGARLADRVIASVPDPVLTSGVREGRTRPDSLGSPVSWSQMRQCSHEVSELGIDFPLFAADIDEATGWELTGHVRSATRNVARLRDRNRRLRRGWVRTMRFCDAHAGGQSPRHLRAVRDPGRSRAQRRGGPRLLGLPAGRSMVIDEGHRSWDGDAGARRARPDAWSAVPARSTCGHRLERGRRLRTDACRMGGERAERRRLARCPHSARGSPWPRAFAELCHLAG